ncbi:hypothetical protein KIPB_003296, partial [Kipferlia bialata]
SGRERDVTDLVVRHLLGASGDRESDLLRDIRTLLPRQYQSNRNGLKEVSRCQIETTLRVLLAETQSIVQCLHEREGGLLGVLEGWLHQQHPQTGTASRVALGSVLGGLEGSLPYDRVLANRGYGVCQTLLGQLDLSDPSDPDALLSLFIDPKETSTHTVLYHMGVTKQVRRYCLIPFLKLLGGNARETLSSNETKVQRLTSFSLWPRFESSGLLDVTAGPDGIRYSIAPVFQATVQHLIDKHGIGHTPPRPPTVPHPQVPRDLSDTEVSTTAPTPQHNSQRSCHKSWPSNGKSVSSTEPVRASEDVPCSDEGDCPHNRRLGETRPRRLSWLGSLSLSRGSLRVEETTPPVTPSDARHRALEALVCWVGVCEGATHQLGHMLSGCLQTVPTAATTLQQHISYVSSLRQVTDVCAQSLRTHPETTPLSDAIIGCVPPFPMVRHLADIGTYLGEKTVCRQAGESLAGLKAWRKKLTHNIKRSQNAILRNLGSYRDSLPTESQQCKDLQRAELYLTLADRTDITSEGLDEKVRLMALVQRLGMMSGGQKTKLGRSRQGVVASMVLEVTAPNGAGLTTTKPRDVYLLTDRIVITRDHMTNRDLSVLHEIGLDDVQVTYTGPVRAPTTVTIQAKSKAVTMRSLHDPDPGASHIGLLVQRAQEALENTGEDPVLVMALDDVMDVELENSILLSHANTSYLAAFESLYEPLEIYRRLYDRVDTLYGVDLGAVLEYMRALHTGQHPEPPSPLHASVHVLQLTGPNLRLLSVLEPLGPLRARLKTAMIEDTPLKWVDLAMEGQIEELQSIVSVFKAQMGETGVYAEGVEGREGEMKSTWLEEAWDTLYKNTQATEDTGSFDSTEPAAVSNQYRISLQSTEEEPVVLSMVETLCLLSNDITSMIVGLNMVADTFTLGLEADITDMPIVAERLPFLDSIVTCLLDTRREIVLSVMSRCLSTVGLLSESVLGVEWRQDGITRSTAGHSQWQAEVKSGVLDHSCTQAALFTLSPVHVSLAQVLFDSTDSVSHQRLKVVQEVLQTEITFNSRMAELLTRLHGASQSLKGVQSESLSRHTRNVTLVREVSSNIITALENMVVSGATLGDVFIQTAPQICHFKPYIGQYEALRTLITEPAVHKALSREESRSLDLAESVEPPRTMLSLIIEPVQRTMRYKMLAEEYMKHTPTGHPELEGMRLAVDRLSAIADGANETKRQADQKDSLLQLCDDLSGANMVDMRQSLLQPHRCLIGKMELEVACSILQISPPNEHTVYLLNDILLVMGPIDSAESMTLIRELPLESVEVTLEEQDDVTATLTLQEPGLSMRTLSVSRAVKWGEMVLKAQV